MRKLINFFVYTVCCFGGLLYAEETSKEDTFIVGTTAGYAPYVSINEKGVYEGFDVDFANLLAKKINKKLVLQDLGSMPSLLLAVQKKKVDAVIWAVSITEERQKEMELIYYQGEKTTELPIVFLKEIPKDMKNIEDLGKDPKYVVSVEAGSFQDAVLTKYPKVKLRYLDKIADAIMALKCGKCFAAVIDNSLVATMKAQHPELKVQYMSLPPSQQALGNGVVVNKTNAELIEKIKKAVAELQAEGEIAKLEKKWKMEA